MIQPAQIRTKMYLYFTFPFFYFIFALHPPRFPSTGMYDELQTFEIKLVKKLGKK